LPLICAKFSAGSLIRRDIKAAISKLCHITSNYWQNRDDWFYLLHFDVLSLFYFANIREYYLKIFVIHQSKEIKSMAITDGIITVNDVPTFAAFTNSVAITTEDTAVEITFADLLAKGNSADVDGTVDSFTIKALASGTVAIGSDASTATAWNAATNNTIDATHHVWWTPDSNANGTLDAFTVVAHDIDGGESVEVQAIVEVTPVNDAPT
jgi:hypothetical protein